MYAHGMTIIVPINQYQACAKPQRTEQPLYKGQNAQSQSVLYMEVLIDYSVIMACLFQKVFKFCWPFLH